MSYITEAQLASYRSRTKTFSKNDVITLNESSSRDKTKPMIFLSHKHDELVILHSGKTTLLLAILQKHKLYFVGMVLYPLSTLLTITVNNKEMKLSSFLLVGVLVRVILQARLNTLIT